MFDIGFFELFVLAIVGLLVLGPQRLPQAVRTVGLYIGRIRKAVTGIQQEVNEQLQLEEMRQRLAEHEKKVKAGILDAEKEIEQDLETAEASKPENSTQSSSKPSETQQEDKSS